MLEGLPFLLYCRLHVQGLMGDHYLVISDLHQCSNLFHSARPFVIGWCVIGLVSVWLR